MRNGHRKISSRKSKTDRCRRNLGGYYRDLSLKRPSEEREGSEKIKLHIYSIFSHLLRSVEQDIVLVNEYRHRFF